MTTGFQELVMLMLIIAVLSMTGLWPKISQALRELRGGTFGGGEGESGPEQFSGAQLNSDLCYRILGVSPSASMEEVEKAFRRKAKIHHPDRGGDPDAMRALNEAYSFLRKVKNSPK
jgi:hypothetical protein